jgi:RNA polymerase sigma-70 factor (ECF subfamily)
VTHFGAARDEDGVRRELTGLPDPELLRANDAESFAALYDRHVGEVLAWARRRSGGYAADLTAETFARAWLGRRRYRDHPSGSALPWLLGIAANVLRDSLRKRQVENRARLRLGLPERLALDPQLEAVEDRLSLPNAVLDAVAGLSEAERTLLRLRAVDERPYSEIAARLGCTPQAARLRVSRLLRQLQLTFGGPLP